jgi:1-acyl-sn-glycerol-3-phosphate acyltransferase
MAFPEGKRSTDGRLMDFKGGLFSMAVKTNVPIIPITIGHANAVMPGNSLFPVQPGGGKLHVHVHEAIDTAGKTDDELVQLVRAAFLSTLPFNQHPQDEKIESTDSEPGIKSLTVHASSTHHQPSLVQQHHQLHAPDATMLHHDKLHHVKNVPFFIANNKEEERETVSK